MQALLIRILKKCFSFAVKYIHNREHGRERDKNRDNLFFVLFEIRLLISICLFYLTRYPKILYIISFLIFVINLYYMVIIYQLIFPFLLFNDDYYLFSIEVFLNQILRYSSVYLIISLKWWWTEWVNQLWSAAAASGNHIFINKKKLNMQIC